MHFAAAHARLREGCRLRYRCGAANWERHTPHAGWRRSSRRFYPARFCSRSLQGTGPCHGEGRGAGVRGETGGAASRPMNARTVSGGLSEDANVSDVEQVRPVGGAVDADAQDGSGTIRIGMRRVETVRVGDGRGQWGQRGRRRRWGCGRKQSVVLARKRRSRVWQLHVAGGVPIPLRRAERLAAHHIVHGGKGGGVVKVAVCEDLAPRDLLLLPRESDAVIVRVARVLAVPLREQEQVLLSGAAVRQRTAPWHRALPSHRRGWRVSPIRVGWRGARHERS